MRIKFANHRCNKIWEMYQGLLLLCGEGKGGETMMICYPDAPFHWEGKQILYELDGVPQVHHYQEKVYDYPVKTINEWIGIYNKQGRFVN